MSQSHMNGCFWFIHIFPNTEQHSSNLVQLFSPRCFKPIWKRTYQNDLGRCCCDYERSLLFWSEPLAKYWRKGNLKYSLFPITGSVRDTWWPFTPVETNWSFIFMTHHISIDVFTNWFGRLMVSFVFYCIHLFLSLHICGRIIWEWIKYRWADKAMHNQ